MKQCALCNTDESVDITTIYVKFQFCAMVFFRKTCFCKAVDNKTQITKKVAW